VSCIDTPYSCIVTIITATQWCFGSFFPFNYPSAGGFLFYIQSLGLHFCGEGRMKGVFLQLSPYSGVINNACTLHAENCRHCPCFFGSQISIYFRRGHIKISIYPWFPTERTAYEIFRLKFALAPSENGSSTSRSGQFRVTFLIRSLGSTMWGRNFKFTYCTREI